MAKKMLIDATHPEETRVVVVDGNKVEEFDFETVNKRQLAGNIYLAKVTRVEPSLQAAFIDYGGNRHGFLAFAEIHPDYYQIPVADRKALLEEERALARAEDEEENGRPRRQARPRRDDRRSPKPNEAQAEAMASGDAIVAGEIGGMDLVDLDDDSVADTLGDDARDGSAQPDNGHDHDSHHDHGDQNGDQNSEGDAPKPFRAMDHASDTDDDIESIAEEDVAEEISAPRRPRARRYKIQEVVKVRQIMLVQVVKEERGNKGAALTTYLSLAGRYCVLMPNTARGGGISRKITQAADRKKLKEIASEIEVPEGAGLIIRTAGAKRTKPEILRDYEYLMRLWEQVRELTLKSIAPSAIYEEGNLIKRSIRDLYNRDIDEVLVEGEAGYRTAKDFMRMIMPSHAKLVRRHDDPMPLFAKFQVESYLSGMFNPVVQLKSGGYIVIGVTEALVAIDVNSGRATKEGSIEDTALKTNLEASDEVARQLRLRDLAGLIVIDYIDMEERRNNAAVEKRLKDKLKTDRARIQVGRISGFGLMEMSRQRLRPGMLESTTQPCSHCHGTGLIRSSESLALQIIRQLEEEGTRKRSKEVLLRAPIAVANFIMNQKREHIALIEARYGMSVRVEADPALVSPDFVIDKMKVATRVIPEPSSVISGNAGLMGAAVDEDEDDDIVDDIDDVAAEDVEDAPVLAAPRAETNGEAGLADGGKKKRRRRRRRKGAGPGMPDVDVVDGEGDADDSEADGADETAVVAEAGEDAKPTGRRTVRRRGRGERSVPPEAAVTAPAATAAEEPAAEVEPAVSIAADEAPRPARARRPRGSKAAEAAAPEAAPAAVDAAPAPEAPAKPKARRTTKPKAASVVEGEPASVAEVAPIADAEPAAVVETAPAPAPAEAPQPAPAPETAKDAEPAEPKEKRKGWWSLGR